VGARPPPGIGQLHSCRSPSMAPAAVRLHFVAVLSPPHTFSISFSVRSRAPRRTNTLFWSFILFLLSLLGPLCGPWLFKRSLDGESGYTSAPHSLLKVSPSALAFLEVGAVQRVAVRIPPPTCSTSCSLKARAPRRSNTRFRSFIVLSPFRDFGQIDGPSLTKELSAALKRSRTRLAASLTDVLISIWRWRAGAERKSNKASINKGGFCWC
jgi:hypothetical protein